MKTPSAQDERNVFQWFWFNVSCNTCFTELIANNVIIMTTRIVKEKKNLNDSDDADCGGYGTSGVRLKHVSATL